MQVFKAFFIITKKNISSVILYLTIFIALNMLITAQGGTTNIKAFEDVKLKVAVFDRDDSELSKAVKDYLGTLHTLVTIEDKKEKMQDELFYRNVEYILIIPKGFEEKMINGETSTMENIKVPNSFTGQFVDIQLDKLLNMLNIYLDMGYSIDDALVSANQIIQHSVPIEYITKNANGSEKSPIYYYFQFLPYVLGATLLAGLGPILMAFNRKAIKQRNICSAMSLKSRNLQLTAGCAIFSIGIWLIYILFAFILYGGQMAQLTTWLNILNSFVILTVFVSIAFFIGFFVKNNNVLAAMSTTISLALCFIGGIFVPQEIMSESILSFAKFVPTYWYVKVNDAISTLPDMQFETLKTPLIWILIQFGFAIAIFFVALVASKKKSVDSF